jgi:hypothetical protein
VLLAEQNAEDFPIGVLVGVLSQIKSGGQVLVSHTCNLSHSGGRDQEDRGSKPAQASSSRDPILKIPITKKGWRSGLSSSPSTAKKKKKKSLRNRFGIVAL